MSFSHKVPAQLSWMHGRLHVQKPHNQISAHPLFNLNVMGGDSRQNVMILFWGSFSFFRASFFFCGWVFFQFCVVKFFLMDVFFMDMFF